MRLMHLAIKIKPAPPQSTAIFLGTKKKYIFITIVGVKTYVLKAHRGEYDL